MKTPTLSKSKYLAGLQCGKRVWLQCRAPELREELDTGAEAVVEAGREVGERARDLFPGGVLVREEPWQHAEAMRRTRALMDDPSVPAIFEAAFEHAGVRIRVDVLERLDDKRFGLREVKSATSVKDVYLDDLAVQRFVLGGARVRLGSVELVHVDRAYVRGANGIDWPAFFARVDCAAEVERRLRRLRSDVKAMQALLVRSQPPEIEPGRHCHDPHSCEFWAHCTSAKPEDWIFTLPRLSEPRFQELRAAGYERIRDLPEDAPLTEVQRRTREALRSGRPVVSRSLAPALRDFGPPAFFLDFETIFPAIPLYPGTSPYQQIPFQWSLHRVGARGRLTHREFLAEGREDPRRAFAESLVEAIGSDDAPVVVYSHFEKSRLSELVEWLPALAKPLSAIILRLADLLPVARKNVYHPEFGGSFSLKAVAPALVPDFGYGDLDEIADGGAASAAFVRIARGDLEPDEEAHLRSALLAYCARDTLALVQVQRALRKLGLQHTP